MAGMRPWIGAALIATFAVVLTSGASPWVAAVGGAFVPPDIAQDVAAARLFASRVNPYGPAIRDMHARVVPVPVNETFPYFPHPPFSLIVSWPFAFVSFQTAALAWFSFSLGLLFLLAVLLAAEWADGRGASAPPPMPLVLLFFAFLLAWPPVLYNLEKGQWSILLAVLVTLGWRALSRGRAPEAGAWIGLAASVKVFPVLLGGYLLVRARRALIWFVATGLLATGFPLLFIGIGAFAAFIGQSRLNMPYWETFPSVTYSLHGALARLLIGGAWARPAIDAPVLARVLDALATLALLGCAGAAALRASRHGRSDAQTSAPFAAWVAILPVLNPQSLGHNGVLLALPLVLSARALLSDGRMWLKVAWGLAFVLVSIPRQTLARLAPPPIDPMEGLAIVALPMWGALLLFGVAVATGGFSQQRATVPTPGRPASLLK